MFKPPKNPKIEELTKSYRDRSFAVGNLKLPLREDGTKGCVWCCDPLKSKHHMTRYCNDENCPRSLFAWSNPQKNEGLFLLMQRQDWMCRVCSYDYKPFIEEKILKTTYGTHFSDGGHYKTDFNNFVLDALKSRIELARRPEVDHIVPIYKGGQSLGLDNHQCICYTCHKAKTRKDLSGKRKNESV